MVWLVFPVYLNFLSTLFEMRKLLFCLLIVSFFVNTSEAQIKSARINHIAFSVLDLKRSTDFYTKIIQLDTIPEPFHDGRHTWLAIGDACHLHLIQNPGPIVTPSKNTHICFTTASVEQFVNRLHENKVSFEDWQGKPNSITIRVDGVKQIYFNNNPFTSYWKY